MTFDKPNSVLLDLGGGDQNLHKVSQNDPWQQKPEFGRENEHRHIKDHFSSSGFFSTVVLGQSAAQVFVAKICSAELSHI